MFAKLLVANRGEIACRVIGTARKLGVATAAVYSDADAGALHVALADEAHRIGPAPAAESYLRGDAILEAAGRAGADAVHPGYGFLAENAGFAAACADAGIVFVGPPPRAIEAMADKAAAKALMAEAGVPVVPGDPGADQGDAALAKAAARVGYPVLIKPVAGGGGKGMRVVHGKGDFAAALAAARREAEAAFGDGRVMIERCLERPRHVEVQVFADRHGAVVHLFERDCSLQRRHQKIVEEAPAPGLGAATRTAMGEAAVAAARAVGYVGAGTVEFLLDADGGFFFMEMNTRLQVEHPVTEMVTGHDLVAWQLRVAAGEPLPCAQAEIAVEGHAVEARLYAEDPGRGFVPSSGRLIRLRLPPEDRHVRVDTGVREGDAVTVHYDPMIAKLIAWDRDRGGALARLRAALAAVEVAGVVTNAALLAAIAGHDAVAAGAVDTGFVARHAAALAPPPGPAPDHALALACLDTLLGRAENAAAAARRSHDPYSPWHGVSGWRLNDAGHDVLRFRDGDAERAVTVRCAGDGWRLELSGGTMTAAARRTADGGLAADLGGERVAGTVVAAGDERWVLVDGAAHRLAVHDPRAATAAEAVAGGRLVAPMPGRVVAVNVAPGCAVRRGAPLMVLEAMKMEHTIAAPADGRVAAVHYAAGDVVEDGAELIDFETDGVR